MKYSCVDERGKSAEGLFGPSAKKLQEMYNVLNAEPKIKEYFDIEVRFNIMLADVNKIISESVKDLL